MSLLVATLTLAIWPSNLPAELPGYLSQAFIAKNWVVYSPTGPSSTPSEINRIKDDLRVLGRAGFAGIVTYGCDGLKRQIPKVAREAGISHVVLGVYDPGNGEEMANAKSLATWVDAYCVGNEGLLEARDRYTIDQLRNAMDEIRRWTGRPVSTSEQVDDYLDETLGPQLIQMGDWVFPNVHPFWHGKLREPDASDWTREQAERLREVAQDKFVFCKEVGLPTGSEDEATNQPLNETSQADYYQALRAFRVPFVYFEAYDQVWKRHHPVEGHWGLFDKDRNPKLAIVRGLGLASGVTITIPKDGDKLRVTVRPDGGFFGVEGNVIGLSEEHKLLMFVHTGDIVGAPGWFLQFGGNGVLEIDGDRWYGRGQIGDRTSPPRPGQKIRLAVFAVPKSDAERLIQERSRDPSKGIERLPTVDAQWQAVVREVTLEMDKK